MKFELFKRVALAVDVPEHRLKKGGYCNGRGIPSCWEQSGAGVRP